MEPKTKSEKDKQKLKTIKWKCSEVSVNSPGNPGNQSCRRKGRQRWEGFAEKECYKKNIKK